VADLFGGGTPMTLDIGMLGYRFMGQAHSSALARLPMFYPDSPETNRAILVGRDEEALGAAADRLGFDRTATDWATAIEEVDVLYNLGPNNLHPEPSVRALDHGVPVLCEKPMAATLDGAERMAQAAASADVPSACGFNYRYVPAIQLAKRLVEDGAIGDVHHVRARYLQDWLVDPTAPWSWRNSAEVAGSGALGDLGAHSLDLARFLVGGIDRVSGHLRTFVDERPLEGRDETRPVTVDDAYTAQVEFESGAIGLFEASRFAAGHKNDNTIEINGSEGSIRFSLEQFNELEVLGEDSRGFETILVTDPEDPYVDAWWPPGHVLGWEHTFVHENYEFLTAVSTGNSYSPDFADGLRVQHLLDAIEESDERGEWVEV